MLMTRRLPGRTVRHLRIRRKVIGTSERPRLVVFRSLGHIYAQVVDDASGKTMAAADSRSKDFRQRVPRTGNVAAARAVGELLAERARARGVEHVVFDRGGYQYHGRVKALAEGARAGGLVF
ncbi:MAG TPA: 50S ribosomal protein L18 [Candidatus Binatia bacterium]|jgi:large subunit ribosomal protein L18|nr:50S ribosomal protein L18 [Candidatus Binatia bacterium]